MRAGVGLENRQKSILCLIWILGIGFRRFFKNQRTEMLKQLDRRVSVSFHRASSECRCQTAKIILVDLKLKIAKKNSSNSKASSKWGNKTLPVQLQFTARKKILSSCLHLIEPKRAEASKRNLAAYWRKLVTKRCQKIKNQSTI